MNAHAHSTSEMWHSPKYKCTKLKAVERHATSQNKAIVVKCDSSFAGSIQWYTPAVCVCVLVIIWTPAECNNAHTNQKNQEFADFDIPIAFFWDDGQCFGLTSTFAQTPQIHKIIIRRTSPRVLYVNSLSGWYWIHLHCSLQQLNLRQQDCMSMLIRLWWGYAYNVHTVITIERLRCDFEVILLSNNDRNEPTNKWRKLNSN